MRTAILGKGMWIGRRPTVLTIGNYVKVKTLEEAYELNQARNSRIMGGMMWMRLGNARVKTIIDMSDLGLNEIEETDHVFRIGDVTPSAFIDGFERRRGQIGRSGMIEVEIAPAI